MATAMPFQRKPKSRPIEVKPIFVIDFPKNRRITRAPITNAYF